MSYEHNPLGGPIRILTVDDHALLREGIAALVNAESDMKLVAGVPVSKGRPIS
jgi:DNA-binding NarL/FixJ family response regulator